MSQIINNIEKILKNIDINFNLEKNKNINSTKNIDVFAMRKAQIKSTDFVFIFYIDDEKIALQNLKKLHKENRKFANSFYKMPKWFRFAIPNIITIIISNSNFSDELQKFASAKTTSMLGGEVHSVHLIDLKSKQIFNQGKSIISMSPEQKYEFKNIDSLNRSFYLLEELSNKLFVER